MIEQSISGVLNSTTFAQAHSKPDAVLKEQQSYRELGPGHADEQVLESSKRWAIRRLEQLGFAVTLAPKDHEEVVA